MTQMDARIAELVARLTALERERAEIVAEIDTLQSARSGKTPSCRNFCAGKGSDTRSRSASQFARNITGKALPTKRGPGPPLGRKRGDNKHF
jgi:hypothetical protein